MNYANAKTRKLVPVLLSVAITLVITASVVLGMTGTDPLSVPSLAADAISAQTA